jgi:site-specific DNA-cytosine methylase
VKPRLLDLYSCAGGAAKGYTDAGFEVVGIDNQSQPNFPYEFHQADALEYLAKHWREFDAVHASPPCQASTALTKGTNKGRVYPNLIPATRELLAQIPLPSVIENVQGAKVRKDLVLCGEMFGLGVIRHRYFELNFPAVQPAHVRHRGRVAGWRHGEYFDGPYFAVYGEGGGKGTVRQWQEAMGIHWTADRRELAEAIPPAYARYVGEQLLDLMTASEAAA